MRMLIQVGGVTCILKFKRCFTVSFKLKQETPQCDETRFSTIQPSIDVTGIRNERWQ